MGKDFKIGLVCGLILAIVGLIWVATRPSLSPEARMLRSAKAAAGKGPAVPAPSISREQSLFEPDAAPPAQSGARVPPRQAPLPQPASSAPAVDSRGSGPDLTIYEQAEKIKTTKFHIVRKNETLSTIARQYYGSPDKWHAILEANKDRIKDANRIQPGTKLTIPEQD
ncbi:MAG: hypothetical protein A2Y77_02245 [Planctomycetes bacterium RBG_13_62_9]|nr:MAG: hypothetical protein A2Y77_02245 [Planctomycetes bacterium RBG_13_62_9]